MGVNWGFSWSVVITGLVVVFIVLLILVAFCFIMGKIFSSIEKKKSEKVSEISKAQPVQSSPVKTQSAVEVEAVQDGIGDDVVAAITAAVAVMMSSDGEQKPFAVKSIKRSRDARPAWKTAGISDNTRPF